MFELGAARRDGCVAVDRTTDAASQRRGELSGHMVHRATEAGAALLRASEMVSERAVDRVCGARPDLAPRDGPPGRAKCVADMRDYVAYLAESVSLSAPALFTDYVSWAKVRLARRGADERDLVDTLGALRGALGSALTPPDFALVDACVAAGLTALDRQPDDLPCGIADDQPHAALARAYLAALLEGNRQQAATLVSDALDAGVEVREIYLHVFQTTQHEIGRLWQTNRVSVAQEHYCTAATQLIMSQLYPRIFAGPRCGRTMVAACASGDLHEIGVRMVADLFELDGWDTHYLGASVPADDVVQTVIDRGADVLAASATLTVHVPRVAALIAAMRAAPTRSDVVILVGGYPFSLVPDLWRDLGADGSAADAGAAPRLAARLLAERGA